MLGSERWVDTPTPPALQDPPGIMAFQIGVIVIATYFMIMACWDSYRCGRLTYAFLFFWNSVLCYWMETAGDWGQHLVYSPKFWCHHLLDWIPYKTPNDPVFMPFTYGMYWTFHSILLMWLAPILQHFIPKLTLLQAVLVVSLPLNYALDIVQEGICTYLGYWTYGECPGSSLGATD